MRGNRRSRWTPLVQHWPLAVALAYFTVPVPDWGFLSAGRPLHWLGVIAVATTIWLWWSRRHLPFVTLLAIALGVKLVSASIVPARGFRAEYHADAGAGSTPRAGVTRIDDRLQFGGAYPDFPLYFFNDSSRFNFYLPGQPQRDKLAFSVSWLGFIYQRTAEEHDVYLLAPGATARVMIGDGAPITVVDAGTARSTRVPIPSGWQPVRIEISAPYGSPRRFEAGWIRDGRHEPFDTGTIFQSPVRPWRIALGRLLHAGAWLFDAVLLTGLVFGVIRTLGLAVHASRTRAAPATIAHPWSTLIVGAVLADAALFALPAVNRVIVLGGGGDPLAYETMARQIAAGGPLMTGGAPLGQGLPYYWHPLYPYFLALCHWLTGEGVFGIFFVQRFLLGVTVIWLWRMTAMLFGESIGRAGLVVAAVVIYVRIAVWAGVLLSDVLFIPLLCGWAVLLVRVATGETRRQTEIAAAGVVWGLATLTRGTPLLGCFLVLPVFAVAIGRRHGTWWRPTLLLVGSMLAVVSLATVRNYIVAGRFVPIFTSGSASLIIGNPPPSSVRLTSGPRDPFYRRLGIDDNTRAVVEYAIQAPARFAQGLARKALYMLGWFDALVPGAGWSLFLTGCWVAAGVGALLLAFGRAGHLHTAAARALPAAVASVHVAAAVVIFPHVYGDRLILPIYAVIVPYIAVTVATAWTVAARAGRASLACALIGAALVLCVVEMTLPGYLGFDFDLLLLLMLAGALALGERFDRSPRPWAFAVLAAALSVTLLSAPTPDAVVEYRRQLAVLALALVIAPMAAIARTHRVFRVAEQVHRRAHWRSAFALAGATVLTVIALQWVSRPITTLPDALSLSAWQWAAGGRSVLAGHWGFGLGLSGPPPVGDIRVPTMGAGGSLLWFLVATGIVGATCYVGVWCRALWISARPRGDQTAIALHGALLAVFAVTQRHNLLAGPTAMPALLSLVGLTFGFIEATTYVPTDDIEPNHS